MENIITVSKTKNSIINKQCIECLIDKKPEEFPKGRRSCRLCCNLQSRP